MIKLTFSTRPISRAQWKTIWRQLRIVKREAAMAHEDRLIFGTGFLQIGPRGAGLHSPGASVERRNPVDGGAAVTDKPRRHRWGDKVVFPNKSERECLNGCGIVKVTRHEGNSHWVEFWRGLDKISVGATPVCEPARTDA